MNAMEFEIQGVPVSELAREYGTPLYVYDTEVLRTNYQRLRENLHPAVDVFFSLKANPNISICSYLGSLGAGAEVSSLTELITAQRAGVAPGNIIFLGPGKTTTELRACLEAGLHAVVCESLEELRALDALAVEAGLTDVPVLLRMNPDFQTKGGGLSMGGKPRQFGVDLAALRQSAGSLVRALRSVRVIGVHAYMGTRILDYSDVVNNTTNILSIAETLCEELGVPLRTVDFGGGLGVPYFDNEKELDLNALHGEVNAVIEQFVERHPQTRLIMELGRYLTAVAGTYVVRVLYVKESMGERFAVADGGTNHHMAAVGVGSFVKRNFPIRSLSRYHDPATSPITVTGPLCTPNDVIGKRVALPPVSPGDLLGVERSGAYGPTASPVLFLSHGYPAEVLVHDGTPHLIARRDTPADLLDRQHLVRF